MTSGKVMMFAGLNDMFVNPMMPPNHSVPIPTGNNASITDVNLRFLAAEQIREVVYELYRDEIPYAVAVEVEEWKEGEDGVRVRANLLVERESQKGIVVGRGGGALKALGMEARRRLAERLHKTVHLKLHVKLDKNWTKSPKRARELGYL